MIKIYLKVPRAADLVRTAMAEVEKGITKKAKSAATPHGGIAVDFERNPDGSIRVTRFRGSDAAIAAAKAAVAS